MNEAQYQSELIGRIKQRFPECLVFKMDPAYQQGILDLLILCDERWASLEVKASSRYQVQPNQEFFVQTLDEMSFAAYIYPENEEEVLNALQQAFEPPRRARVSKS